MAKCDLCDADCSALDMAQLLGQYQAAGVCDVCPSCRSWADKKKDELLAEVAPRMREAVAERKQRKRNPWWQAWLGAAR